MGQDGSVQGTLVDNLPPRPGIKRETVFGRSIRGVDTIPVMRRADELSLSRCPIVSSANS